MLNSDYNKKSKKNQQVYCTFLCRCCGNVKLPTVVRNFMEKQSYIMCSQKILLLKFRFPFYSLPLFFTFLFSPLLQNVHIILPTKLVSLTFYLSLQLSVTLFLLELCQPVAYFLVFLFLYIPNFVDMTININLSLTL